ncbi:MAG TPA: hypothetical protein VKT21_01185 [Thermoplasmata archaeon]|nr:hypothetical protein [Thermoplasmata archaeon]
MNRVITLIGVSLVGVGLVLSFVPLFAGPSKVLTPSQPTVAFNATGQISLSNEWTIGVSWTSDQAVSLLVVVCASIHLTGSSLQTVCPGASLSVLNGTAGSSTFSVPFGGTLLVGIVSNTTPGLRVDLHLSPTLALIGTALTLGGVGVAAVGVLPQRKRRPSPPNTTPSEPAR